MVTFPLLERIFTDTTKHYPFAEAREKGLLFFKCANEIHADLQGDYWIQVASNWDINFHNDYAGHYYMSVYRIEHTTKSRMSPVCTNLLDINILV